MEMVLSQRRFLQRHAVIGVTPISLSQHLSEVSFARRAMIDAFMELQYIAYNVCI